MKISSTLMRCIGVILFVWVALSGCERRPLEDEEYTTALIPVRIDWSESGIPKKENGEYEMHRASIYLFPQGGGEPLEYRMEGDLTYREISVPVGTYSVLIFNETIDEGDWESIYFTGTDRYETFAAYAKPDEQRGFYSRASEATLCKQPDPLASWSLNQFVVTGEMVAQTRKTRASGVELVTDLTRVKPKALSKRVQVKARVINLVGAMQATGIVKGVVTGVMMASGEYINELASHAVLLNGRQLEPNGKDGTIGTIMYIFEKRADGEYSFQTDFILTDGTLYSPPVIKGPDLFKPGKEENTDYLVDVGIGSSVIPSPGNPNPDPDIPPIELPESSAGGADVEVGDWDEVIIPMD